MHCMINMDDSLRFKTPTGDVIVEEDAKKDAGLEKDFRGVACPMELCENQIGFGKQWPVAIV